MVRGIEHPAMSSEIADAERLLRGILFRHLYWDAGSGQIRVDHGAFLLRPADRGELSVQREALAATAADAYEDTLRRLARSEAVASLAAGRVREMGLRVGPRPTAHNPAHAAILGLPEPDWADMAAPHSERAIDAATMLLALASLVAHRAQSVHALIEELVEAGQVVP